MTPLETYLTKLCELQKEIIETYHHYIHASNKPVCLDDATPREWSLASRCHYLERDNKALRELAEEWRSKSHEGACNQPNCAGRNAYNG